MNMEKNTILVVDDDSSNLALASKILCKYYRVACATSGALALKYLEKNCPALILMDINMPEMDGFETLSRIRSDGRYKEIPVIFLTADKSTETEKRCFREGAIDFVGKPFVPDVLLSRAQRTIELNNYRCNLEDIISEQKKLLEDRTRRINAMQESVIVGMANIIELRDSSTGAHVKNTQTFVRMIVEGLMERGLFADELDEKLAEDIVKAAPLHDIGKIRITDSILLKPGKLTDEEYNIMKKHTEYGMEIIRDIISDVEEESYVKTAQEIALCHHERPDGTGYPNGLKGDEIPLSARIMSCADVFDALYAERCYKKPVRPSEDAISIMMKSKGTQFDAVILDTFAELLPQLKRFLGEVTL